MHQQLYALLSARATHNAHIRIEMTMLAVCNNEHLCAMALSIIVDRLTLHLQGQLPPPAVQVRNHRTWVRMTWEDWWRFARLNKRQGARVLRDLKRLGLIQRCVMMDSYPRRALYVSLNEAHFAQVWNEAISGLVPTILEAE